jgi:hypothetical protein
VKIYKLFGTPGNNTLETVLGTPSDDKLYPMGGWDFVDGGTGKDTVYVQGPAAEFKIIMADGVVYVDTVAGASAYANRVQLKEVEEVQFTDKRIDLVAAAPSLVLIDEPDTQNFSGGLGLDRVVFGGKRSDYDIAPSGTKYFVTPTNPALGRDSLQNIERLQFSDQSLALDVPNGVAGTVAKFLGVVFGPAAVLDRDLVGIGLHHGAAFKDNPGGLMRLALDARLGPQHTSAQMVELLYANLFGQSPPPSLRDEFVSWIDRGLHTQESLALLAADLPENLNNISWMGLVENGLPYDPMAV